jgi:hypothetical protein
MMVPSSSPPCTRFFALVSFLVSFVRMEDYIAGKGGRWDLNFLEPFELFKGTKSEGAL